MGRKSKQGGAPLVGVIYGRQSRTREGSESLDLQEQACREAAKHHGVEVLKVILEPPSTSAFKDRGRRRPRFPELVKLVESGQVNVVIAYKLDRLSRGGGPGWAPLLDAAENADLDIDRFILTPSGFVSEVEIGIRATMDREESKKTSERLRDMKDRLAAKGRHNGGNRPFGYAYGDGGLVVVPEEADMIRRAVERFLAGETLGSICREWNCEGLCLPKARNREGLSEWTVTQLRRIVAAPRIAGCREADGKIIEAEWEPIIDRVTWERVARRLRTRRRPGRPKVHEPSGILRCGKCGKFLRNSSRGNGRRFYVCPSDAGRGCGALGIVADKTEERVRALLFAALDGPALAKAAAHAKAEPSIAQLQEEIEAERAKLLDYAVRHDEGRMTQDQFELLTARVNERIAAKERRFGEVEDSDLDRLIGDRTTLREAWEKDPDDGGIPLARRFEILKRVFPEGITVKPAGRGTNRFDPDRLVLGKWSA